MSSSKLIFSKPGGWQQSDSLSVTSNSSDVMPSPPSSVCSNGRYILFLVAKSII